MKLCAYMTICLCLPFVLLADDDEKGDVETSPDDTATDVEEVVVDPDFERFKTILDRMPFGRPPPGFDPDSPGGSGESRRGADDAADASEVEPSEVEQQILSSVRVSILNVTPAGKIVVGFTDSSVQPAKNYLMEVGEKREQCEWQVVEADPETRQVKLSKDGVAATLRLGGGSAPVEGKQEKEGEEGGKAVARPGMFRGRPHAVVSGGGASEGEEGKMTGLDIARARRQRNLQMLQAEREQQRQAAEQAKQEREQAKHERELAAEERKAQLSQLMQIQEELRRQREEKLAERERRAAAEEAEPPSAPQTPDVN